MSAKTAIKTLCVQSYRRLPSGLRDKIRENPALNRLRERFFLGDPSLHDQYYSETYYDDCGDHKWAVDSAPYISADIIEAFHPKDMIDVGCGLGDYIDAFRKAGVRGYGVELATSARERCLAKGLEVAAVDLTSAEALPWRADVVCSIEVAEHLPASGARNFVRLLTRAARQHIVLTAARPGQPGLNHINCQPKDYWIKMVAEEGFDVDQGLIDRWEAANRQRPKVAPWFSENLMVFHRRGLA